MPEVVPEGYSKVRWIFRVSGLVDDISTGLGFINESGQTPLQMATACAEVYHASNWGLPANRNDEWTFVGCEIRHNSLAGVQIAQYELNSIGTQIADAPPVNCAILATKQTALGGRRNRGRMYWPPCNLGEISVNAAGFLLGGTLTAFQTSITAFYDQLVTAGLLPVLFHSEPGSTTPTGVTGLAISSQLATQRERMR